MTAARFRADPSRVRVAVRWLPEEGAWLATVEPRGAETGLIPWGVARPFRVALGRDPVSFTGKHRRARVAVLRALRLAEGNVPGIDLAMQWAYGHPFGAEGKAARREQDSRHG